MPKIQETTVNNEMDCVKVRLSDGKIITLSFNNRYLSVAVTGGVDIFPEQYASNACELRYINQPI
jgi:hypothetical protein